jgi:hypothetical protein
LACCNANSLSETVETGNENTLRLHFDGDKYDQIPKDKSEAAQSTLNDGQVTKIPMAMDGNNTQNRNGKQEADDLAAMCVSSIQGVLKACGDIASLHSNPDADSFKLFIELNTERLFVSDEMRQILSRSLDTSVSSVVLRDLDHPKWSEQQFRNILVSTLGTVARELIDLLGSIKESLEKARDSLMPHTGWSWLISFMIGKSFEDLRARLETLKSQNRKIQSLVARAHTDISLQSHCLRLVKFDVSHDFDSFKSSQSVHSRLFETLSSTFCCRCHKWYMKLDKDVQVSSEHRILNEYPHAILRVSSSISETWRIRLQLKELRSTTGSTARQNILDGPAVQMIHKKPSFVTGEIEDGDDETSRQRTSNLPVEKRDLCDVIDKRRNRAVGTEYRIGTFGDGNGRIFELYALEFKEVTTRIYSLSDILLSQQTREKRWFYKLETYRVAYMLARSLLLLTSSPWYKDQDMWTKDGVLLVDGDPPEEQNTSLFGTPFVALSPTTNAKKAFSGTRSTSEPVAFLLANATIYALGIILIELAFLTPIENLVTDDERLKGERMEILTAMRLEREDMVLPLMGRIYANVVFRCLKCHFGTAEKNIESANLQEAFYEDVVCQLYECFLTVSRNA